MHFEMIAMEVTDPHHAPRKLGRPLSFNRDMALRQAMLTFWRYGYETASVADLTAAMGISAPSLYAAFGDKRRLFLEAMRLYAGDANLASAALDVAPTSRDAARELMIGAAIAYTGEDTPKGCLLASATASGSAQAADLTCNKRWRTCGAASSLACGPGSGGTSLRASCLPERA
jgi:AcrR family transcriptional regulator